MEEKLNKLLDLVAILNRNSNELIRQSESFLSTFSEDSFIEDSIEYEHFREFYSEISDFKSRLTTLQAELNGYMGIRGDKGLKQLLKDYLEKD